MRAGYLTFALAALGLWLVGALAGPPVPPRATVAAVLGLDGGDLSELEGRRALAVAARTAGCMRMLGFAYDPIPAPAPHVPDATLDPVAWAARWGFGVTTSVGMPPPDPVPDINAVRVAKLSADDRERYVRALHGGGGGSGCLGAATNAVYGLRERLLAPLQPDLIELDRRIDADPGMDAVRRTWAGCVGPAIASLRSPRLTADRVGLPAGLLGWFASRLRDVRTRHDLANTQVLERTVAVAIARCEAALASDRARIAARHEADFLRTHGTTVTRIGADIRAAEDGLPVPLPLVPLAER